MPAQRLDRILLGLAIAAPAASLLAQGLLPRPGDVALKASMCVLLAAFAWRSSARMMALALLCSAAGDAFLGLDGERLFVPGLASFLVTHLLYAVIFVRSARLERASLVGWRRAALVLIPAFAASFAAILWPRLGALSAPVMVYMTAIVTMAALALRLSAWTVPVGAMLFVASDSLIALGKFLWRAPWMGPLIWITYALAQLMIVHGVVARGARAR